MHPNIKAMLMARRIELVNELVEVEAMLTTDGPMATPPGHETPESRPEQAPIHETPESPREPFWPTDDELVWFDGDLATFGDLVTVCAERHMQVSVTSVAVGNPAHRAAMVSSLLPLDDALALDRDAAVPEIAVDDEREDVNV